jgi:hypothetical protein
MWTRRDLTRERLDDGLARGLQEVTDDDLAQMTQAEDEPPMAEVGIVPHQMDEDWLLADPHHGFGHLLGQLSQAHAESTAEEHDHHPVFVLKRRCHGGIALPSNRCAKAQDIAISVL